MAAPAVSAVAALIVGKYGSMNPDALANRLAASADILVRRGRIRSTAEDELTR